MTLDDENMFCKPSAEGDRRSSEGRVDVRRHYPMTIKKMTIKKMTI